MNLHDTYRELEQDARDYADAGRALAVLRRRRAARTGAGAVLAAVAIAGGFGLRHGLTSSSGDTIAAIPTTATATAEPAPPAALPAAGPIGRGAAVYAACRTGCPTLLDLVDGRKYTLGTGTVYPPGNITLSPDGRWLGVPTAGGYELRDLLSDVTHRIPVPPIGSAMSGYSPWAWSDDSARLILGYHADGDVSTYTEVDLTTGRTAAMRVPPGHEPVGILPSGEVILLDETQYGERPRTEVRLRTGATETTFRATGTGVLSDADHGLWVQVSRSRIFLLEYTRDQVAVLEFDPAGRLTSRTPLPEGRYAVGPTPYGYAVLQVPLNQRTGRQQLMSDGRVIHEFPGEAEIVIPGGARH
ncbi:hypothetical protein Sru01_07230 [Sphaerisporangium rufum]|uniref:Uncharacterized protein n=1 Tax=Sphaerisporangium rufum TaxID=1381558 RepID=A0A919QX53_9ACTN|nr:hypothetical protein [Sphaerisporangium rufum]GII75741.1 hypothetical protein Sru01_07230 [Sphaerisporangium rufum]